jgi:hypothetical protein
MEDEMTFDLPFRGWTHAITAGALCGYHVAAWTEPTITWLLSSQTLTFAERWTALFQ